MKVFPETWEGVIALDTETYGGFGIRTPKATEWACPYSVFMARLDAEGRIVASEQIWIDPSPLDEAARTRSIGVTANLCAGRLPEGPVPDGCEHYLLAERQHAACIKLGYTFEEATRMILEFVGGSPAGYLGSNVQKFDIDTALRNIGCKLPKAPVYDTRELYGVIAAGIAPHKLPTNSWGTLDRGLGTVGRILGVGNTAPHTAEGDVVQCIDCAVALKRMDTMLRNAWSDAEEASESP